MEWFVQKAVPRYCFGLLETSMFMLILTNVGGYRHHHQSSHQDRRFSSERGANVCWPGKPHPCCPGWEQYYTGGPCLKRLTRVQTDKPTCRTLQCQQQCHVINGVARCFCHLGYELQFDGISCKEKYNFYDNFGKSTPITSGQVNHRQTNYRHEAPKRHFSTNAGPVGTGTNAHLKSRVFARQGDRRPLRLSSILVYSKPENSRDRYPSPHSSHTSYHITTHGNNEQSPGASLSSRNRPMDRLNIERRTVTKERGGYGTFQRPIRIKAELIPIQPYSPKSAYSVPVHKNQRSQSRDAQRDVHQNDQQRLGYQYNYAKQWEHKVESTRRRNAFFTSSSSLYHGMAHQADPGPDVRRTHAQNVHSVRKPNHKLSFQLIHNTPDRARPETERNKVHTEQNKFISNQWNYNQNGDLVRVPTSHINNPHIPNQWIHNKAVHFPNGHVKSYQIPQKWNKNQAKPAQGVPNINNRGANPCTGIDCYHGYQYNIRLSSRDRPRAPVHMYPTFNMADYVGWLHSRGINYPQSHRSQGWLLRNDNPRLSPLMTGITGRPVYHCDGGCTNDRAFQSAIHCSSGCNLDSYQRHVVQPCGYSGCQTTNHEPFPRGMVNPCLGDCGERNMPLVPCSSVSGCSGPADINGGGPCSQPGVTCDGQPIRHHDVHHKNPCPPEQVYVYLEALSAYQCMLVSEARKLNHKGNVCPEGTALSPEGVCVEKPCAQVCKNGGKCVNDTCECPKGFTGKACELDVDECKSRKHGCQHACNNTYGSYVCSCPRGMNLHKDNKTCIAAPPCDGACTNGATCVNEACVCQPGYKGKYCESDMDECETYPNLCEHECVNTYGSYKCACPTGKQLNDDLRTCANNTCIPECMNGGVCHDHRCRCAAGYYGSSCELDVDECYHFKPCSHECHNTVGSFYCSCPEGMALLYHQRECGSPAADMNF